MHIQTYARNPLGLMSRVMAIESTDMRNRIRNHVMELSRIIRETRAIEPDAVTQTRVAKFFDYLEDSCKSREKLNVRAQWLDTYGTIALGSMQLHKDKFTVIGRDTNDLIEELFAERIKNLIGSFRTYHTSGHSLDQDGLDIIMVILGHIANLSAETARQRSSENLRALCDHMKDITDKVNEVNRLGGQLFDVGMEDHFRVRLLDLYHNMRGVKQISKHLN